MSDGHRHKKVSFRPPGDEVVRAREELEARGRPMGEFLRACLRAVAEDPDGTLARLDPVWPEPQPLGRPAAGGGDEGDGAGGGSRGED